MNKAPFKWKKTVPSGSVEQSTFTAASDSMARTLDIYLATPDLRTAIGYILGTAQVIPAVRNNLNSRYVTPAKLSRTLPAKHPDLPWLRATKILSCTGIAANKRYITGLDGLSSNGDWKILKMSILFEHIPYTMLNDGLTTAEYQRWCLFTYDGNVEIQARKGEVLGYLCARARAAVGGSGLFPGDRLLRTLTGILRIQWFNVPEAWLYLGAIVPTNFALAMSTVNLKGFPQALSNASPAFAIDQNTNLPMQFRPGTLLLASPPKTKQRTYMHPAVLSGQLDPGLFARSFDADVELLHFDPATDDTTMVRTGGQNVLVRGHNLTPMPRPSATNFRYYTVGLCNPGFTIPPLLNNASLAADGNIIASDASLAYPYTDFESLFGPPQSLLTAN